MLTCDAISCTSWGRPLFKELGICLPPGALLAVLGGNPKAKTAFLRALAAELAPKRGEVLFKNRPVLRDAGYAANVIYLGAQATARPRAHVADTLLRFAGPHATRALVPAALKYFGLADHAGEAVASLPPHLCARIPLARLIATPRLFWFLDMAAIPADEEGKGLLYALIANRCNQDGIVVMAAQTPDFIAPMPAIDLDDFT